MLYSNNVREQSCMLTGTLENTHPTTPRGRIGRPPPFGGGTRQQALRSPEESRPRRYVSADIFLYRYKFITSN